MKKTLFAFTASAALFTQPVVAENMGVTSSADPRVTDARSFDAARFHDFGGVADVPVASGIEIAKLFPGTLSK